MPINGMYYWLGFDAHLFLLLEYFCEGKRKFVFHSALLEENEFFLEKYERSNIMV